MEKKIFQHRLNESLKKFKDRIAVELAPDRIAYHQLDKSSDYIANWLIDKGVEKETFIGIMTSRRMFFITLIIAILKARCVFVPLDPANPPARLRQMINTAHPGMILIDEEMSRDYSITNLLKNKAIRFLVINHLFENRGESDFGKKPGIQYSPEDKIYIYFTSGTTGKPKAIIGKNKSLLHFINWEIDTFGIEQGCRVSQFTTPGFDAFLRDVFVPLCAGGVVCIPNSGDFLLNPDELIQWIDKSGINLIHCVPGLFRLLDSGTLNERHFKTLRCVLLSGEKINPSNLVKWYETFNDRIQLVNFYGPTETTMIKTFYLIHKSDVKRKRIPIGKPVRGARVIILDKNMEVCGPGVMGEIYIRTPYRTFGYYNAPGLTKQRFIPNPFNTNPGDIIYKTGDLGRFLPDGNIEFLGRIDRQVKISGIRVELEEIEHTLSEFQLVKEAVVVKKEISDNECLAAYITVRSHSPTDEKNFIRQLRGHLHTKLPDNLVPAHLVLLEQIPKTPNGKIKYDALPTPVQNENKKYISPRNKLEKELLEIWSQALGFKKLSVKDNFFQLGGNSLNAMSLISKIHGKFHIRFPFQQLFQYSTIEEQAAVIRGTAPGRYASIDPVEKKEYYPLSSAQRRLYILQQMDTGKGIAYNMPSVWQLEGELDEGKIERVFYQLIQRHEGLRTFFTIVNDEPVQRINEENYKLHQKGTRGLAPLLTEPAAAFSSNRQSAKITIKNFIRPFNLSQAQLLRVGLIEINEQKHVLMVDMHHIISDGLSIGILVKEFTELYGGKSLPGLRLQYKDYSEWQNRKAKRKFMKEQAAYWLKQFAREVPALNLPTDYPRPAVQDFAGEAVHFEINKEETTALKSLARERDVTLFMLLLSLYNVFLGKLSGQEDIVVGTPAAGRCHANLEGIIGMFVNTLALRNFPIMAKTFPQFLREIKENTIKAFENRDYLYENLVEQVEVERDTGRNPLFDTVFALQNLDTPAVQIPGLKIAPYHYESRTAKFDLTLTALEVEDRLDITFEYCTGLFKKKTIQRFIGFFKKTVSFVLESHETGISGIDIITEEEKNRILLDFNDTGAEYPRDKTIHQLFAEQVERTPDHTALIGSKSPIANGPINTGGETYLTYKELNGQVNRLAYDLTGKGIGPGAIVGIMVGRCLEMAIGILGVLKAGAAYLPLNPDNPRERNRYMLQNSSAQMLLTEKNIAEATNLDQGIDDLSSFPPPVDYLQLAYVIYTSGSTGNPKGVPITHGNFSQLVHWGYRLGIGARDRVIRNLSFYFDWSVWEMFIALTTGASLAVIGDDILFNPEAQVDFLLKNGITVLHITPTQFRYLLNTGTNLPTLRYLFIGAEKLTVDLVEPGFAAVSEGCRVFNMYGPTETTIISAVLELDRRTIAGHKKLISLPIGKPVGNNILLVLDRYFNLCPIGISGELYIAGGGLACGYLNSPELTAERFCLRRPGGRFLKKLPPWTPRKNFLLFPSPHSPIYKTGDLAQWLPDGNILFLGRIDHQVKIRGFRIELGEIESHLKNLESIKEAVVVTREDNQKDKCLCAYVVFESGELESMVQMNLNEYLAHQLPGYMIPSYFIPLKNMPLTPNGKIDRKSLPAPGIRAVDDYPAPGDEIEMKLLDIWGEILGIEKEKISITDNFFRLGGHSLKATLLIAKIHKQLNAKVPLAEIFQNPNISGIARYIKKTAENKYAPIEPVEKKEYYPLSSAQTRLYILQRMHPRGTGYNMSSNLIIEGDIDKNKLSIIFNRLITRHEILRTSFRMIGKELAQRIHDTAEIDSKPEYSDLSHPGQEISDKKEEIENIIMNFIRPFDLSLAPLLRVGLIKIARTKHILMLDMHHIASDAVSITILEKDFSRAYFEKELPPRRLQYKDFARWQNSGKKRETLKHQEEYWLQEFEGEIPRLNFPTDYDPPEIFNFKGDVVNITLEKSTWNRLKELAGKTTATLNMVLLAVYYILLAKYSREEDIVVGSAVAGRRLVDLQNMMGMFVNMLSIRTQPRPHKTFKHFLIEVKDKVLKAMENQDYPFDELVSRLKPGKESGRNPLFNVVFNMINIDNTGMIDETNNNIKVRPYQFNREYAVFDLILSVSEPGNRSIHMWLLYSTQLFKRSTVRKIADRYIDILNQVMENIEIKIEDIRLSHNLARTTYRKQEYREIGFGF